MQSCAGGCRSLSWSLVSIVGVLAACHRHEYRVVECEPPPPASAGSAIGWEAAPGQHGSVIVRLRSLSGSDSLAYQGPSARLDTLPWRSPGRDGVVRFDSVRPGSYELTVRAVGYLAARATIRVQPDSGVVALAAMAQYPVRLDGGCGQMLYPTRKPWWRW